jgi:hypothetical protein
MLAIAIQNKIHFSANNNRMVLEKPQKNHLIL